MQWNSVRVGRLSLILVAVAFMAAYSLGLTRSNEPTNLTMAKRAVFEYYDSGKFDKELTRVVERAIEHFKPVDPADKLIVTFDIDDTVLTNYADMKKIDFGYLQTIFHDWVMRADAPALVPVRRLYEHLRKSGYFTAFITNRQFNELEATRKNLESQGFTGFSALAVRPKCDNYSGVQGFKEAERQKLVDQGYTIVGTVGDQWGDVSGKNIGYPVKLPNYLYYVDPHDEIQANQPWKECGIE